MSSKKLTEFALIDALTKNSFYSKSVVKGVGDDTAVLQLDKNKYELFTTDILIEDVHFTRRMKALDIGHKALACSISDIAAMGGIPTSAVVSFGIPKRLKQSFVIDVNKGIQKLAAKFKVDIVGGDISASEKIIINIALLGEVKKKNVVYRSGAKCEDFIFVTGSLGGSFKNNKHLTFTPRVAQAKFLVEKYKPNAMLDISDGLIGDLKHITQQSRLGALLFEEQIPRCKDVKLSNAFYDGEDFELLFTVSQSKAKKLRNVKYKDFQFFEIGRMTSQFRNIRLINGSGKTRVAKERGYEHF